MNSSVSLDARIFDSGDFQTPPTAPPRKKRASTLKKGSTLPTSFPDENVVPNGFKDVFIRGSKKVLNYDDIEYIDDREESAVQTRASVEHDDGKERKLKVGNKKTDKFFGESLSDHLSDEPVVDNDDQHASIDEADRSSTSDKKLFFLMNMLEQEQEEEFKYIGKEPIEEPLFVARKKEIKKHICDDDDHMHNHKFHKHEKEPCDHNVAPPKPDRDFSKYQGASETDAMSVEVEPVLSQPETKEDKEIQAKIEDAQANVEEALNKLRGVKKSISREDLPKPPAAPQRKSGVSSIPVTPETPSIRIESFDFNSSIERDNKDVDDKFEKGLNRAPLSPSNSPENDKIEPSPTSSTPILAHELVDRMIKKAYGFHGYHPEDFDEHNHDDGSSAVAPTSKLLTRKLSDSRKISTGSMPSSICSEPDSIGRSNGLVPPGSPRKKISFCEDPLRAIDLVLAAKEAEALTPPKSPVKTRDYEKILASPSMNDIIDEIYSKNSIIMEEFQSYLEKSIETQPVINVDQEKEFLKEKGITGRELNRTPEPIQKLPEPEEDVEDNQSYSDSFESTDTEQETVTEMGKLPGSKFPKYVARRRESIEDVDGWFNNHLDLEQKKSELTGPLEAMSSSPSGYDTHKIFPFGKTITGRRDSMSDEFFVESPVVSSKPSISTLRESDSDSENEKVDEHMWKEKSPDHSSLYKYLDKSSPENVKQA